MCSLDLDPCDLWSETRIGRARKEHRCDCCGGPICVGSPYTRIFMVAEGYASTETECDGCSLIAVLFKAAHRMRPNPSSLYDMLSECFDEDSFFNEEDERIPVSIEARWWKSALEAMDGRRKQRDA